MIFKNKLIRFDLQGKNLKLIEIVKWNIMVAGPYVYFITLKAEDPDAGGSVNTYQVEVVRLIPEEDSYVSIFRVKSEQLANSGKLNLIA
mgnify:CR=1 FL=1